MVIAMGAAAHAHAGEPARGVARSRSALAFVSSRRQSVRQGLAPRSRRAARRPERTDAPQNGPQPLIINIEMKLCSIWLCLANGIEAGRAAMRRRRMRGAPPERTLDPRQR
ncbi:hypothetical protein [Burkholderia pseudomallei]|uniref:hypothetical protein n=1 Tax=Burkholderia pseudomallei TaxID=28450 RepID=UPI001604D8E7